MKAYPEKRKSSDRRVLNDLSYIGTERRTGIDARGWKKAKTAKQENSLQNESDNFDWFSETTHNPPA